MEKVSVAPPRVPPTDPLEDSIYGCISSLFDVSDRSALEDALASAAASPSPSLPHSTISGSHVCVCFLVRVCVFMGLFTESRTLIWKKGQ